MFNQSFSNFFDGVGSYSGKETCPIFYLTFLDGILVRNELTGILLV
jgi:hypothetical protein